MTPLETLAAWLAEAESAGVAEASAMALASVSPEGAPSVRFVLCRGIDARGVRFFTNYESRKAGELDTTGRAAAAFHWAAFGRQVRVEGRVIRATAEESNSYFHSRARGSQIAATLSHQSRPLDDVDRLRKELIHYDETHGKGPIPRPENWGGYWLLADAVELWTAGEYRLHDRIRYERDADRWSGVRLAP